MKATLFIWALCSLSFIGGFLLCTLVSIGCVESLAKSPATHSGEPSADDYIDWSKVADGYDWVAVDEGGMICKYAGVAPHLVESLWVLAPGGEPYRDVTDDITFSDAIIGPLPPWRESLRQRPKAQEKKAALC